MWLLSASISKAFDQAQKAGMMPSGQEQLDYEARIGNDSGDSPRLLTVAGNNAEINISGPITNRPSLFSFMFGGGNTTYSDIITALSVAEQDPEIENITLAIDSPGGTISGLFDTLDAIQAAKKPIEAVVSNMAASAAYAIAASADKITATNKAAMFGSVGIVVSGFVDPDEVTITSTDAPKKRPDMTTEEGQAVVREELDALHEIFVESIADGRGSTVDTINAEFGQGATLLANDALKRGMIDSVQGSTPSLSVVNSASTAAHKGITEEGHNMDLITLQAQHPDVYAAAVEVGTSGERERVASHLIMGDASGDMKTAIAAAKDGTTMTASLQATYMAAGMNRSDTETRQNESDNADAGDAAAASVEEQEATANKTLEANVFEACGVEMGAQ